MSHEYRTQSGEIGRFVLHLGDKMAKAEKLTDEKSDIFVLSESILV